ncbi:MAG: hypothetical protein AAF682_22070 [Planctomycetota bacterium]
MSEQHTALRSPLSRFPVPFLNVLRGYGALALLLLVVAPLAGARASAQTLVNGGSVAGTISTPSDQDSYTFYANAGEGFQLRLVDVNQTSMYPRMTLYTPAGAYITYDADYTVAAINDTADFTGLYSIVVEDGSTAGATGDYKVYLALAPGANEGGALTNGGSVAGSVGLGDLDSYTFSIQAGEGFQIRVADVGQTDLYPRMTLYAPSGAYVTYDADYTVPAINATAAFSGTYTLVVADGTSSHDRLGDYEVHFVRAPGANEGGALVNGGSVDGSLGLGDLDSFTFSINAGEGFQIRLVDLNGTPLYPRMTLYSPSGAYVTYDADYTVPAINSTAAFSGTYTLVVADGTSSHDEIGDYRLYLVQAPDANEGGALINGGRLSGTLELGDLDSYSFSIQAGEGFQIRLADIGSTNLYPRMTLYSPSGAYVTYDADYTVAAINATASFSGTYTLVVADGTSSHDKVGDYDVYFVRAPGANEGGALLNGGVLSDALDLGDLDSYTFTATAGQGFQIRLVDVESTGVYPRITLYAPAGGYVTYDADYTVAAINATASFSGTYTVVVADGTSSHDKVGAYDLHFALAPGANEGGTLLTDALKSDVVDLGDLDSYTFLGAPGEVAQVTVTDTGSTSLYPRVTLYDPAGSYVTYAAGATTAVLNASLTQEGLYTLVVADGTSSHDEIGAYTIVLTGSGTALPPDAIWPAELPTDPALADAGGTLGVGPRIGDPSEPFNIALDCTSTSAPSVYLMQVHGFQFTTPLPTQWGWIYVGGPAWMVTSGVHTQSVETWYPQPGGFPLPSDTALVGVSYTVQGFCGDGALGRVSNALAQTIGE